jgi:N-6 DNA Methylase
MRPSSVSVDHAVVRRALRYLGAPEDSVVVLNPADGVTGVNADYADLMRAELGQAVGAVIEKDGSPVLYIADLRSRKGDGQQLARLLGNRGETAALIGIDHVADATMSVKAWPCTLEPPEALGLDLANATDASAILADLQTGIWYRTDWKYGYQEESLRDLLISSVMKVSEEFTKAVGIKGDDPRRATEVLALIGRALFTRFLLDRGILSSSTAPALWKKLGEDGTNAFESASRAAATCKWLDDVFNGEFLRLDGASSYLDYFTNLESGSPGAMKALGWIVNRTEAEGQLPLWDRLDFSYIPAGTLSEVYEHYAHSLNKASATATSIHFTPRHLARVMVRQALAGLGPALAHEARLLDPAVGAGVFLSIGFREIVKRRAIHDGAWPSTETLRDILYGQMRGMDINGAALNLAALTMYLTVVELDADPLPPEKLKFKTPLLGSVVFDLNRPDDDVGGARLGSLREECPAGSNFDVIIGNPPWTSPPNASDTYSKSLEYIARRCIQRRAANVDFVYHHPDKVPDIGFFWKCADWLREGGVIALILHQRLLIKRSPNWSHARQALLASFKFHGIINAGQFADHHKLIWPSVESPFCIVFATNEAPPPSHRFRMLNLELEPTMKKRRQLRIDPGAVFAVTAPDFEELPGAMIVRTKGCELDRQLLLRWQDRLTSTRPVAQPDPEPDSEPARVDAPLRQNLQFRNRSNQPVVRRASVRSAPLITIGSFIDTFAAEKPLRGIKKGDKGAKLPDTQPRDGTLMYSGKEAVSLVGDVDASEIKTPYVHDKVKSGFNPRWFEPPLLLIKESPGERFEPSRTTLITSSGPAVAYPFTYIGVPVADGEAAMLRAKYLSIWINSSVFSYFTTLTATRFAFGRKVLNDDEIFQCPIVDLAQALNAQTTTPDQINELFQALKSPSSRLLVSIDELVGNVLGLDAEERQLIEDTLSISYPIGDSRQSGKSWVRPTQYGAFVKQLRADLQGAEDIIDVDSVKEVVVGSVLDGWCFVSWKAAAGRSDVADGLSDPDLTDGVLLDLVKRSYPSGQVIRLASDGKSGVFGQLALTRLWLPSRATLVAQTLIAKEDASRS